VAGADAVVGKSADPARLGAVIRAVAAGERHLPSVSPQVSAGAAARLVTDDLPILGMLRHAVPADEIAATLGLEPGALAIRRWAMLEALTTAPARRDERRPAAAAQATRTLSSPTAMVSPGWS
jgi:DNA-binding NarL/FixJ family response regulator